MVGFTSETGQGWRREMAVRQTSRGIALGLLVSRTNNFFGKQNFVGFTATILRDALGQHVPMPMAWKS